MDHLDEQGLGDYLAVLRRHIWIVLLAIVLSSAVAVELSLRQPKLYSASADVLLTSSLTGVSNPLTGGSSGTGVTQTETEIAGSPAIASGVVKAIGITDRTAGQIRSEASFGGVGNADVMQISITDADPGIAVTLANAYARQYMVYRRELGTSFIASTRKQIEARMATMRATGEQHSAVYDTLAANDQNLLNAAALQTASAVLLTPASGAGRVQASPIRNGILGFGVGLMLGIALALLWDAADRRVRTAQDVCELVGLPILGRLSAPRRRLRRKQRLLMLEDARGPGSETLHVLRTNLEFADVDQRVRLVLITSASEGEGKSTTAANLAIAIARTGRRVLLVDFDLRRPTIEKFFGLESAMGLTDVALGHIGLDQAIVRIPLDNSGEIVPDLLNGINGNGAGAYGPNALEVLPCGTIPPNPGELVATSTMKAILDSLRDRASLVLIDTPPLLEVSDTLSLSAVADGIVLVSRLGTARRPILRRTRQVLDLVPAVKLGVVVTGAQQDKSYGGYERYGSYYFTSALRPDDLDLRRQERAGVDPWRRGS